MPGVHAEAPGAGAGTAPLAPGGNCAFAVGRGERESFSEAWTASVTALAPPDQGKSGCPFAAVRQG